MSTETWVTVAFEAAKWVFGIIERFVDGDRSEDVMRFVDIVPKTLRSRLELVARRKATEDLLEDV